MSSHPSAHQARIARPRSTPARTKRDSDAFVVALLTMLATLVAAYDFLLLGLHAHG